MTTTNDHEDHEQSLHPVYSEHERLEKDPLAGELTCGNELCSCVVSARPDDYCGEYCRGEAELADGKCQCGHAECT